MSEPTRDWRIKNQVDGGPVPRSNFFAQDLNIARFYLIRQKPLPPELREAAEALELYPLTVLDPDQLIKGRGE